MSSPSTSRPASRDRVASSPSPLNADVLAALGLGPPMQRIASTGAADKTPTTESTPREETFAAESSGGRPSVTTRGESDELIFPSVLSPPAPPPSPASPSPNAPRARLNPFATPFKVREAPAPATLSPDQHSRTPASIGIGLGLGWGGQDHVSTSPSPTFGGNGLWTPHDQAALALSGGGATSAWWAQAPAFVPSHHRSFQPAVARPSYLALTPTQAAFPPSPIYAPPMLSHIRPAYYPSSPAPSLFHSNLSTQPSSPASTTTQVFIGNLSPHTGPSTITALFAPFGELVRVVILKDQETGLPKGCAFVEFETEGAVARQRVGEAIEALEGREVHGRRWRVEWAKGSVVGGGDAPPNSGREGPATAAPGGASWTTGPSFDVESLALSQPEEEDDRRSSTPVADQSRGGYTVASDLDSGSAQPRYGTPVDPTPFDWASEPAPPAHQHLTPSFSDRSSYSAPHAAFGDREPSSSPVIFCGNLAYATTEQDLTDAFSRCGRVVRTFLPMDRELGHSKGFGYIEFFSADEAAVALREMGALELNGRRVRLDQAEPAMGGGAGRYGGQQQQSTTTGFGGGGSGGLTYATPQRPSPQVLLSHQVVRRFGPGFGGGGSSFSFGASVATYPNSVPLGRGKGSDAYARSASYALRESVFGTVPASQGRSAPTGSGREPAPHLARIDDEGQGDTSGWNAQSLTPLTYEATTPTRARIYVPPHISHPPPTGLSAASSIDAISQQLGGLQLHPGPAAQQHASHAQREINRPERAFQAIPGRPAPDRQDNRLEWSGSRTPSTAPVTQSNSVPPLTPAQSPEARSSSFESPRTPTQSPTLTRRTLSVQAGGGTPTRRSSKVASFARGARSTPRLEDVGEEESGTGWDIGEEVGSGWALSKDAGRSEQEDELGGW